MRTAYVVYLPLGSESRGGCANRNGAKKLCGSSGWTRTSAQSGTSRTQNINTSSIASNHANQQSTTTDPLTLAFHRQSHRRYTLLQQGRAPPYDHDFSPSLKMTDTQTQAQHSSDSIDDQDPNNKADEKKTKSRRPASEHFLFGRTDRTILINGYQTRRFVNNG